MFDPSEGFIAACKAMCGLQEGAVGPHPTANLEVLFTRHRFTYMLSYMTFHVAPTFSTLVHELTADQVGLSHWQTRRQSCFLNCGCAFP